uniref:Uncharacterized protein n=1 Tax=Anguilla anguilla TaxID=7936 RepID=A0A0E9QS40_ANGAN
MREGSRMSRAGTQHLSSGP